jgi:hypothetical protein
MVYLKDEGSEFDAPIDHVWKYMDDGEAHDAAHKTTRNPKFEKVSEITFVYASERLLRGKWTPDRLRISMFPPVFAAFEWLDGPLAGSKFVYVYKPRGEKTGIDVYGEFVSNTLAPGEVEATAREFLDSEFDADAPAVRASYHKAKSSSKSSS